MRRERDSIVAGRGSPTVVRARGGHPAAGARRSLPRSRAPQCPLGCALARHLRRLPSRPQPDDVPSVDGHRGVGAAHDGGGRSPAGHGCSPEGRREEGAAAAAGAGGEEAANECGSSEEEGEKGVGYMYFWVGPPLHFGCEMKI